MGLKHMAPLTILIAATLVVLSDASLAPALFILGDSTVDTGNQNYISSVIKSNFPPYGKDLVPPGPTGRFSNGKLANDYIAEYLGLPSPVNYLSPMATGSALLTGVNIASSGSGYLDITGQLFGVVNLTRQLDYLGLIQNSIIQQIGQPAAQTLFQDAIYLLSTGSNDFINNYNINPLLREKYTPPQYQQVLLDSLTINLKTLYNYGARKVFIDSLGPLGCAPEQLLFYNSKDGKCIDSVNSVLVLFNSGLKNLVLELRAEYPDYQINYVNIYDTLLSCINNPQSCGFKYGNTACCGEGPYKGLPCANPISDVCANADDYVFWDLFHPTQHTYTILFQNILSGGSSQIFPNNLQQVL